MRLSKFRAVLRAFPVPVKRLMLVFAGVTLLDMLVICFAAKPFPWVAIIPGLIPLFIVALVIIPLKKSQVS